MLMKRTIAALVGAVLLAQATFALASDSDTKDHSPVAKSSQSTATAKSSDSATTAKSSDSATTAKSSDSAAKSDSTTADGPKLITVEQQMIEQTNAQRAKYGLPALVVDQSLEKTARHHTAWMTNSHTLQHSNANVGENIAMGQHTTKEAVNDWMNSPGHRANILNSSYKKTGVAAYTAEDGTVFWCQQFLP
jgi:uncharacterized protein YkwD